MKTIFRFCAGPPSQLVLLQCSDQEINRQSKIFKLPTTRNALCHCFIKDVLVQVVFVPNNTMDGWQNVVQIVWVWEPVFRGHVLFISNY